jgi:aspartyl-tRNA(Asn)/glutamyl-tRNA(Gln) amidotransferase subunit C
MSAEINVETFNHLVRLAALELSDADSTYLRSELNKQLNVVEELSQIPVGEDVPPARHGVAFTSEQKPALREDVWQPFSNPDDILLQAPEVTDRFYVVPDIPHTRLE